MKKSVMKKWVAALRSGKYIQGRGQLVDDEDRFCCLGVLCDLALDLVRGEWERRPCGTWEMFGSSSVLPKEIVEWSGMKSDDGYIYNGKGAHTLASMNDNGKSFAEIADIIEANWEQL